VIDHPLLSDPDRKKAFIDLVEASRRELSRLGGSLDLEGSPGPAIPRRTRAGGARDDRAHQVGHDRQADTEPIHELTGSGAGGRYGADSYPIRSRYRADTPR
jgi:hypothetical protein